jgi:hypothetical protein
MPCGGSVPDRRDRGREGIFWLIRGSAAVLVLAVIVLRDVDAYGFERDASWGLGAPMSLSILFAGVLVAAPLAVVEGFYARRRRHLWIQISSAVLGASVIGWFAGLPVGLRFFASSDAVQQWEVEMALTSFLLMGVLYVLVVMACRRRPHRGGSANS